jgi:hypothetical protein
MPSLDIQNEAVGKAFVVDGVRFVVTSSRSGILTGAEERDAYAVSVDIEIANQSRKRFDPASLSYRLRGGETLLGPVRSTAVGSDSLVRSGELPEGDRVTQKLLFAVPEDTRAAVLEFEPVPNGSRRVRVPIELD